MYKKSLLLIFLFIFVFIFTSCNSGKKELTPYVAKTYKYVTTQEAYEATKLSTVNISSYQYQTEKSTGSGTIIYSNENYSLILTCYHVINNPTSTSENNPYTSCVITPFNSNVSYTINLKEPGNIIGSAKTDIAILKATSLKNYAHTVSIINDDADIILAENIFTVGSPAGYINSYTQGYISNLNRKASISIDDNRTTTLSCYQLDMTVNPGNSGGGLFDLNGNLVGVVNAKAKWSSDNPVDGIGYAIKPSGIYYWYNQLSI